MKFDCVFMLPMSLTVLYMATQHTLLPPLSSVSHCESKGPSVFIKSILDGGVISGQDPSFGAPRFHGPTLGAQASG